MSIGTEVSGELDRVNCCFGTEELGRATKETNSGLLGDNGVTLREAGILGDPRSPCAIN